MVCLIVESEAIDSTAAKRLDVVTWFLDHEVAVEVGLRQCLAQALDDRRAQGEVRYEVTKS